MAGRIGSTVIENVQPQIDCGRHPVKSAVGEPVRVTADVFKEGHDELVVVLRWRQLTPSQTEMREVAMRPLGNDAWEGRFPLFDNGLYAYTVEAWPDLFRSWAGELKRKVDAGREVQDRVRLCARSSTGAKPAKAANPPSASGDAGPVPAPSERKAYGSNNWNAPISASDDAVSVTTEHVVDLGPLWQSLQPAVIFEDLHDRGRHLLRPD